MSAFSTLLRAALPFLLLSSLLVARPGSAEAAEVSREQFTTGIENREPVDDLAQIPPGLKQVFFFSEIQQATGQTVTHRWLHDGQKLAEVQLPVGGSPWRTWSSKSIWHLEAGTLSVQVLDREGKLLSERALPFAPPPAGSQL